MLAETARQPRLVTTTASLEIDQYYPSHPPGTLQRSGHYLAGRGRRAGGTDSTLSQSWIKLSR